MIVGVDLKVEESESFNEQQRYRDLTRTMAKFGCLGGRGCCIRKGLISKRLQKFSNLQILARSLER